MTQHFQSKATPSTTHLGRLPFSRSHKLSCEIIAIPLYIPVVAHHQIHYQNVYLRDASSEIVQREFSPHRIYSSIYTCATIQKKRRCHNKCLFFFFVCFLQSPYKEKHSLNDMQTIQLKKIAHDCIFSTIHPQHHTVQGVP